MTNQTNKKLTPQEKGKKGGLQTWAKVSKEERTKIMRERANQLWAKIKAGKLTVK